MLNPAPAAPDNTIPQQPDGRARTSNDRAARAFLVAASLLATLPVWIPPYPQMADLPQHAAQVQLLRSLQDPAFAFAPLFHINWFTPYLAGYLLVYALVPLLGIVVACKTVIALSLAATPLATALLARETGADARWAPLSILGLYGFTYQWGFLNFIFAVPLGLAFLWLAACHNRAPRWWTWTGLAMTSVALFFCHAMVCAFFCIIAGLWTLAATRRPVAAAIRLLPLALVVPVGLVWAAKTAANPLAHRPTVWDLGWLRTVEPYYYNMGIAAGGGVLDGWGRLTGLIPRLLGVQPGVAVLMLGILIVTLPLLAGARPQWRRPAFIPFAVVMLTLFLVPNVLFGTDYTFPRFTVFALPLFLVTLGRPAETSPTGRLRFAVPVIVLAWIAFTSSQALAFKAESRGFRYVLAAMAPNERALGFAFIQNSRTAIAPSFLHFSSWYTAERGGLADPSFAVTHVQLVLYKPENQPKAGIWGFEWQPWRFTWRGTDAWQYRYFLLHVAPDPGLFLTRTAPCSVRLMARSGSWWLYERGADCPARPRPSGR